MKKQILSLGLIATALAGCAKLEFHGPAPAPPLPPPFQAPRRPVSPRLPDTLTAAERDAAMRLNGIEASLQRLLVTKLALAPGLSESETVAVVKLARDLDVCGLSASGPACLDRDQTSAEISLPPGPVSADIHTVFSRIMDPGLGAPLVYRFSFTPEGRQNKTLELDIFSAAGLDLRPLLKASLTQDFVPTAWNRLVHPREIRELYHMSRGLLNLSGTLDRPLIQTGLSIVMKENAARFGSEEQGEYPFATLDMAVNEMGLDDPGKIHVSEPFLQSPLLEAQELAADTILALEPKREELKTLAVESLYNDRNELRTLGVNALKKAERTDRETNMVISKIVDPSETVKRTAIQAAEEMPVNDYNMANVMQLVLSQDPDLRVEGVKLLAKSDSYRTSQSLMPSLADSDPRVRATALAALLTKSLYESDIARLTPFLANPDPSVRSAAVQLLGKMDFDDARAQLIQNLDDPDSQVRKTIAAALRADTLSSSEGQAIAQKLNSSLGDVRATAVELLGGIRGSAATVALIKNLDDESPELRFLKSTTLARRTRSFNLVSDLVKQLNSPRASVRLAVVNFLSHMQSPVVWSFLRKQEAVETDASVKAELNRVLHEPLSSRTVRGVH